jgi:hypothetical protein
MTFALILLAAVAVIVREFWLFWVLPQAATQAQALGRRAR